MTTLTNNPAINTSTQTNEVVQKYLLPLGIGISILVLATFSEAADADSMGVIKGVINNISSLIKNEGKLGLQVLSAAAGGLAAAKTVTWQPLMIGAGGAGIVEMLFSAIG